MHLRRMHVGEGVVGEGVAIPCNCTPGYAHTGDRPAPRERARLWANAPMKRPIRVSL